MNIFKYFYLGILSLPKIIFLLIKYFLLGLFTTITIFPKYFIIGISYVINPKKGKEIKVKGKPIIPILTMGLSLIIYFLSVFIFFRSNIQRLKLEYLANDIINYTTIIEEEENEPPTEPPASNDTPPENSENNNNQTSYYPNDYWDYINIPFMSVNFNALKQKNPDTVAWLKINNTYVNYPVVQSTDNRFYINHDYNRNSNVNGWIYGDYRDDFTNYRNNTIIYGHNLTNRTMFGSLVWATKSSWYTNQNNQIIKLSTPDNNTVWQIFSLYVIPSEAYYLRTYFDNTAEYTEFLNVITGRSVYNFNIGVNSNDKILTLSTCDDTGTRRIVIHAKMVNISYR